MERARRLASRAVLRRLMSQSKPSQPPAANAPRHLSSLAPSILPANPAARRPAYFPFRSSGRHSRWISVESLRPSDAFPQRHNSASPDDQVRMADLCGFPSFDDATVPKSIRAPPMALPKFDAGLTESQVVAHMKRLASMNKVFKSFIGMGYYNTFVPAVILRNIMENPGWYNQYTPYQAEIAQGRLESLLNFQTMIADLTALPMSNASLLDEGTAAAEAMAMCNNIHRGKKKTFLIASNCHPQTIDICKTQAGGFDLKVVVADLKDFDYRSNDVCGVLIQYPGTEGEILDYGEFIENAHASGVKVVMATDLLALTVLKPPGELGADIVVGSAQRFGVPMGYGGPHAAFLATSQEYKRMMLGRIIGVSMDSTGKPALRMAMQTREQHIRRGKATSNICTAQARGDNHRNVCIIPVSAHGTNPASAAMCGMKIVAGGTDSKGNIKIEEIRKAAEAHKENLSTLMVTYPSTHGVYEEDIDENCKIINDTGGQVYMDGANMNAQVGLTSPGWIGHLNPHKTFCIPHGGGGPGMGPIGVKKHLAPFLPSHPVVPTGLKPNERFPVLLCRPLFNLCSHHHHCYRRNSLPISSYPMRLSRSSRTLQTLIHLRPFSQAAAATVAREAPWEPTSAPLEYLEGFPRPDPKHAETILAIPRASSGKNISAKERKVGRVPSIVFEQANGQEGGNKRLISVQGKQIRKLVDHLGRSFFLSRLFELEVRSEFGAGDIIEKVRVLPRKLHLHSGTDAPLNVTFLRAPSSALLKIDVPLVFRGEDASPGLRKGAYFNTIKRTVRILCPADIVPPYIDVDISELDVGQKLLMRDLKVHPALHLLQSPDQPICNIIGSRGSESRKK